MKRKAFGFLSIFLVLFQMFSPWSLILSDSKISLEKNVVSAQAYTPVYTPEPRVGYIKNHTVTVNNTQTTQNLVFMYVDTPESTGACYSKDINFYIYQVVNYSPDWQSYDETVDSMSDCTSRSSEWFTEKIDINGITYIRHYFGTDIDGFDRRIALEFDLGNINIDVNPDKIYGTDTEEILITASTPSFGPTPGSAVLAYLDGTGKVAENKIVGSFNTSIQSTIGVSPDNADIILGDFSILIKNLGEKWQDNGDKAGEPDDEDDYGAWDSIYDDELLTGDAGKTIDITPDKNGSTGRFTSFDGFIFDLSTNKDFKGDDTLSINLNPYILGKDGTGAYPIFQAGDINVRIVTGFPKNDITDTKNSLKENTTYYARVRVYPDNTREYYGGLMGIPEDAQIYPVGATPYISVAVGNKSALTVVQDTRNGVELNKASGQADDPTWLPDCGASPSTWFQGCLVVGFYYLIFVPTSYLLGLAGNILDFILVYNIQPDAYKAQYIVDGWRFIRDACNLFFIFMLIYLAFKVMLGIGQGTKQLIVNTIIVATVINFSYPLTTVVIDISNITARQLYYNAFNKQDEAGKPLGISAAAAKGYNPQRIVLEGTDQNSADGIEGSKGSIFMILLIGVIFNIVAIIIFLKIALQFIYRIVGLVFAIILSPLAVFSYSLSTEQRGKLKLVGFDTWLNGLFVDAFKAPVFIFFMMILILFVNNNPFKGVFQENVTGIEWWMSLIIPFMLIMAFFKIIESVTKSMSSELAKLAGGMIVKAAGAIAGVAMGGAALAGAGIIGKGAGKLADSKIGQRIMDRSVNNKGLSGFIARQQVRAMRGMQGGSYDLRQTQLGNAVSRESGADFNLATRGIDRGLRAVGAGAIGLSTGMTAGGYMALGDRRNKEREEYLRLVGHNQELEARLKEKMDAIEDRKKQAEQNVKDQRADVSENERIVREAEKDKKEVDERVANFEKLEDLIAKMNDARSSVPPKSTNEIEVQISRLETKLGSAPGGLVNTAAGAPVSRTAAFDAGKNVATGTKSAMKTDLEEKQRVLDASKEALRNTEDEMRNLDKSLSELTKAIENVKNNRANAYAHQIRNRSGGIYRRETYTEDLTGTGRRYSADQENAFSTATGGDDLREEMRNIITSVEERASGRNNARSLRVIVRNTAIGAVAGAFTGGAFNAIAAGTAIGAGTGGVVGIARSYRPENESYRTSGDSARWRPNTNDGYTAPTSS